MARPRPRDRVCYGVDIMMARTQVSLDHELHRKAKDRAARLGLSLAEYFRRLVERDLDHPRPQADPSAVFALGASGGSNVARRKDEYVADAIEARHSEKTR